MNHYVKQAKVRFTENLYPASIYLLKVNSRNTRTKFEICSKLAIKTYFTPCSRVSIVNFEQKIGDWVFLHILRYELMKIQIDFIC